MPFLPNLGPGQAPAVQATPYQQQAATGSGAAPTGATGGSWFDQNPLPGTGSGNFGGGWDQFATDPNSPQGALQALLKKGITGQAAIDILNRNPATAGIAYYPASGQYGLPNGFYVAPNAGQGGQLDLVQRGGGGGQSGEQGGGFGSLNFQQPSLEDARNSPGYQFAFDQGQRAIQGSAAAHGTLLTGGTLKALAGYGTGLADQTYGNVFNRALQTNSQNYNHLYDFANLGVNAAGSAAS